jgi:hypothetical protein
MVAEAQALWLVGWPVEVSHAKDPSRALTVQITGGESLP